MGSYRYNGSQGLGELNELLAFFEFSKKTGTESTTGVDPFVSVSKKVGKVGKVVG